MIQIIIFSIVYIISLILTYFSFQKDYSKDGVWEDLEPSMIDLLFLLAPLFNTIMAIGFIYDCITFPKLPLNKFFKIKK